MHSGLAPSPWVTRFAPLIGPGSVLDVASGAGRHSRLFLARGHPVTAVDIDPGGLADIAADPALTMIAADLEDGQPWPLGKRRFAGVIVTNYLFRPRLRDIVAAVAGSGVLIYETFARGNDRFGRPRNPDFLLRPNELLDAVRGQLSVVAFEQGITRRPTGPAVVQRICARRAGEPAEI